jgi:hypothetical protein
VKYELGFYIPEDGILNSDRRGNPKLYICMSSIFSPVEAVAIRHVVSVCPKQVSEPFQTDSSFIKAIELENSVVEEGTLCNVSGWGISSSVSAQL